MQQVLPLLIGGQPRQGVILGKQATGARPTERLARHIVAATDRVILAQVLLNKRVTKQAQNSDALLHRRVGEAAATRDEEAVSSLLIGGVSPGIDGKSPLPTRDRLRD